MMFETERLIVRKMKFEDNLSIFDMCCDEQTSIDAGWAPHTSLVDTHHAISSFIFEDDTYAIVYKANNKVIGTISLYDVYNKEKKIKELGFCLNRKYRNQGFMNEVCTSMIEYAFRALRLDQLIACHATYNTSCKKLFDKLPFTSLGIKKNYKSLSNKKKVDCEIYELKEEDYSEEV